MNKINFLDSHIYKGCLVVLSFTVMPGKNFFLALAEFNDGSVIDAEVEQIDPEELIIHIDLYTTKRGTDIPDKNWRMKYNRSEEIWKVTERL